VIADNQVLSNDNAGKIAVAAPAVQNHEQAIADDPVTIALQRLHHQVVSEQLPDRFFDLLDQIDAKAASGIDARSGETGAQ
jgi:hypothetical protein